MKSDSATYLIVGNSTAAVGAVEGLRGLDPDAPLVVVSREPYHTYSRPLISYLLAGEIEEERMYYRPMDFYRTHAVDARLGAEVVGIDTAARVARFADGGRVEFERLLIASGGRPFLPPVPGLDARGVFTYASWDDAKAVAQHLGMKTRRAVVIGGGLIGIKAAEALRARGVHVTIVELAERVLPLALDEQASKMAAAALRDAGVDLVCGSTVVEVLKEAGAVAGARLRDGRHLACDTLVVAIGVVPETSFLGDAGLAIDRGVVIDDRCRSSVEGIYAAGDVAQGADMLRGQSRPIPIFPNAYRQGRVAGVNMAGGDARVESSFAMNAVEVFGLPTVSIGLATASGPGYEVLLSSGESARAYKRIVLRDGRIVGALFVGDIDRAGIFTGLIRAKVDVSGAKDLLLTDRFGLISLPAEYRTHLVRGEGIVV